MEEIREQKCNRCKVLLPIYKFTKKRDDKYMKSCERCRMMQKKDREKSMCQHNKQKSRCKECKESEICEHNRLKRQCFLCWKKSQSNH